MCNIYIYFKYYGICIIPGVARVKSLVNLIIAGKYTCINNIYSINSAA